jgi:4'-phosphopantetheinyl transferase
MDCLAPNEKDKINRFYNWEDAQRGLIGKVMIRSLMRENLGIRLDDINIRYNQFGKPYIDNKDFHFNVSHSGQWIVCITDDKPVGIDIEQIVDIDLEEVSKCFSINEQSDLLLINKCQRVDFFFDLWTLKESYLKAIGKGLSVGLNSFMIRKNEHSIIIEEGENGWHFRQYNIDSTYKLSVCSRNQNFPQEIDYLDIDDLIRYSLK